MTSLRFVRLRWLRRNSSQLNPNVLAGHRTCVSINVIGASHSKPGESHERDCHFCSRLFLGCRGVFSQIPGVIDTTVGYSNGHTVNPTYKDVCTDETGHAEVVQVTPDPAKVSFEQLLDAFWKAHDPTQVNRQGPDFGAQYRTAIFTHSPEQEAVAKNRSLRSRPAANSSVPSPPKLRLRGRSIARKNTTRNIFRSAVPRLATFSPAR